LSIFPETLKITIEFINGDSFECDVESETGFNALKSCLLDIYDGKIYHLKVIIRFILIVLIYLFLVQGEASIRCYNNKHTTRKKTIKNSHVPKKSKLIPKATQKQLTHPVEVFLHSEFRELLKSFQLDGTEDNHLTYRDAVCNYLEKTSSVDNFFPNENPSSMLTNYEIKQRYISSMRISGEYADGTCLSVISLMLNLNIIIVIFNEITKDFNEINYSDSENKIYFFFNSEHYSTIIKSRSLITITKK